MCHAGRARQAYIEIGYKAQHNVREQVVRSTDQCNTACSLSAGVWKPKVFRDVD